MADDHEKEGHEALLDFFALFGEDDIYKQVFLEELFRFLFREVLGKAADD